MMDPYALLSQEAMLDTIEALAGIQPYSGWRNSATSGEAEGLDYVGRALGELGYLAGLGMEQERQSFEVPLGTEQWETSLELTLDGGTVHVPASGLRGSRSDPDLARNFDSDGLVGDSKRDPVVVDGPVVRIGSTGELDALSRGALAGRVVVLDYSVIDPMLRGGMEGAVSTAATLLAHEPAGLVLVTQFSNEPGESHGVFAGEGGALSRQARGVVPPTVVVRLEDLAAAGIEGWTDLGRVERAMLLWDADVLAPAVSGNLVVRIPGRDPSRAVILGAHIDSPNNPGAMDDASGSAILIEVARVLDASRTQPPTDLYLTWFGSEELGLLGSSHFVNTHAALLSRTAAMLQIDCLTYPLEGIEAQVSLVTWNESELGAARLDWPIYLAAAAGQHGATVAMEDASAVYSDNYPFDSLSIPNADLIFLDERAMEATGSFHFAAHIHDPYDGVDLAREMADVLEHMARVALTAALEPIP
ncbi:MAG TPA: M28 family metallopeptidase [Anaerolineae bacterium]|nr:M28 family metallopeptidase [Anaerolineae bacterium]